MTDPRTLMERQLSALLVMIRSGRGTSPALRLAAETAVQSMTEAVTIEAGVVQLGGLSERVSVASRLIARGFEAIHLMAGVSWEELLAVARSLASDDAPIEETAHVGLMPVLEVTRPEFMAPEANTGAMTQPSASPIRSDAERRIYSDRRKLLNRKYAGVNRRRGRDRRLTGERRLPQQQHQRLVVERFAQQLAEATHAGAWLEALHAAHALIALELQVPMARRGMHRIAVQRMLPMSTLHKVAALGVTREEERERAARVLRFMGLDGAEAILPLIMQSEHVESRRFLHDALVTIPKAYVLVVPKLASDVWFEVRHAVELVGAMRAPNCLGTLRELFDHPHEDVRAAAVAALAEFPAREVSVHLGHALASESPVLREAAVDAIARHRISAFAMPLMAALRREERDEVRRRIIRTLGLLAAPDAGLALSRIALTKRPLFGSGGYPLEERLDAVAALRVSESPNARTILERIARDGDGKVRGHARTALEAHGTRVAAG